MMLEKHKRKFHFHICIFRYFKTLSEEELSKSMKSIKDYLINSKIEYSTKEEWIDLISTCNLKELSRIVLRRDDKGELLRHTSSLFVSLPEDLILEFKYSYKKELDCL